MQTGCVIIIPTTTKMKTDWSDLYPDWDNSAKNCGPNKYIAGDEGEDFDSWDNILIYYNREADVYYLDQIEPNKSSEELEAQLRRALANLEKFNEKKKESSLD